MTLIVFVANPSTVPKFYAPPHSCPLRDRSLLFGVGSVVIIVGQTCRSAFHCIGDRFGGSLFNAHNAAPAAPAAWLMMFGKAERQRTKKPTCIDLMVEIIPNEKGTTKAKLWAELADAMPKISNAKVNLQLFFMPLLFIFPCAPHALI